MKAIYLAKSAVVALLLLPPFCIAQEPNLIRKSQIASEADSLEKFVPAGWKIEEQVTGDLNDDNLSDYAVKLVEDKPARDSNDIATERQRTLLIVLQKQGGMLVRAGGRHPSAAVYSLWRLFLRRQRIAGELASR
jgi:hypothetical protein